MFLPMHENRIMYKNSIILWDNKFVLKYLFILNKNTYLKYMRKGAY